MKRRKEKEREGKRGKEKEREGKRRKEREREGKRRKQYITEEVWFCERYVCISSVMLSIE